MIMMTMNRINRFLVSTVAAFGLFSPISNADVDHWTCSNTQTVMYFVLNTNSGEFILWDDKGKFLVASKFSDKTVTKNGIPVLVARLENDTLIGLTKMNPGELTITMLPKSGKSPVSMTCR